MDIAWCLLYTSQMFLLKVIATEKSYMGIKLYFVLVLSELIV